MTAEAARKTRLERYRSIRRIGQELISKMYSVAEGPQFDIGKAARKLTLPVVDGTLVFDGEQDTTALADFRVLLPEAPPIWDGTRVRADLT